MEIDFKALEAIERVIRKQSFEKAATSLFVTQSAISQRIKTFEKQFGQPLMTRQLPYEPTELGKLFMGYFRNVTLLKEKLIGELDRESAEVTLKIALNRDALFTWFPKVLRDRPSIGGSFFEVIADDQEVTMDYLKRGLVVACVSTSSKALAGCKATSLGTMEYLLVSNKDFQKKYFSKINAQSLLQAPGVIFDEKDNLHDRYLARFFGVKEEKPKYHVMPSIPGFKELVLLGYAYGLIPKIDVEEELKSKKLVNLCPTKTWKMPMYWHSWELSIPELQSLNELVIKIATQALK